MYSTPQWAESVELVIFELFYTFRKSFEICDRVSMETSVSGLFFFSFRKSANPVRSFGFLRNSVRSFGILRNSVRVPDSAPKLFFILPAVFDISKKTPKLFRNFSGILRNFPKLSETLRNFPKLRLWETRFQLEITKSTRIHPSGFISICFNRNRIDNSGLVHFGTNGITSFVLCLASKQIWQLATTQHMCCWRIQRLCNCFASEGFGVSRLSSVRDIIAFAVFASKSKILSGLGRKHHIKFFLVPQSNMQCPLCGCRSFSRWL